MGEMQGREVELEIGNMAHGGVAVARHEGRVIFVPDVIPGERVLARIVDDRKKSFWRAEALRVVEASPHRREHVWAEAAVEREPGRRAGGADYGHIEIGHQRELKAAVLRDALQRFGGLERDIEVEALAGPADGTGWRTRVRLQVSDNGTVGPYAARSHRVIHVRDLPLAVEALREVAPLDEAFPGEQTVDVLAPSQGGARLVIGRQSPSLVVETVGEREFRVDDTGFWQVHREAPAALTAAVQEAIDPERFDPKAANLDLYGGVGLLAAAVGDRFGPGVRITSVESSERATEHAAENLADWLGAQAITSKVEHHVRGLREASPTERARLAAATVVLDPPRSGAGREVLEGLAAVSPAQLVYVACDPVALGRDVGILRELGYEPGAVRALDLFPSTHHVEAVATFTRA
ncbi:class I SAM-dependent RNA methyltransferase [Homoserinibacter sp. YIM 151385]|uniref:class I SAM-dependent RNA methyltransferase n=1 Tax=Homoserinibacter sp. YIM 151385 TaxID=2985506 RepID=UPI0022F1414B|nr:TRAM domain-containing protein [Homoserinibacter sp. YIM 151385]WBU36804.1 class I SAM-dependent RNA methyltransferase [Homoserinibacter sp. YIM 151385]